MPDVRIVQRKDFPRYAITLDWLLRGDGTLDDSYALATAIIVALGTDRLADVNEVLPDPRSHDRRGWWGDLDAEEIWGGWPIGSRLWLLTRTKITDAKVQGGATVANVENYLREALTPFVAARIISDFALDVERNP